MIQGQLILYYDILRLITIIIQYNIYIYYTYIYMYIFNILPYIYLYYIPMVNPYIPIRGSTSRHILTIFVQGFQPLGMRDVEKREKRRNPHEQFPNRRDQTAPKLECLEFKRIKVS
jgi:hypothetical protein